MIAHHAVADIYHSPSPFTSARPDFINGHDIPETACHIQMAIQNPVQNI